MRFPKSTAVIVGFCSLVSLMGCPWSNSPNVFDEAKGISMPSFGGPPPQSEPPVEDFGRYDTDAGGSKATSLKEFQE